MLKLLVLLLVLLLSGFANAQVYQFKHNEKLRTFILHLPEGYSNEQNYPVVLNFHGLGSFAKQQATISQMNCLADKEKFIVVYPDAINRAWNTGIKFGSLLGVQDDVGFVNALLDTLISHFSVDTDRIYATGMSLGGFFSHRLAVEQGNRFAAIASVSGLLSKKLVKSSKEPNPIPVLQIHGTGDFIVGYCGNKRYFSAPATLKYWRDINNCSGPADTLYLDDTDQSDDSYVALVKYTDCYKETEVWHYLIYNGGHYWPYSAINFFVMGNINDDINGSKVIWEFFEKFSLSSN